MSYLKRKFSGVRNSALAKWMIALTAIAVVIGGAGIVVYPNGESRALQLLEWLAKDVTKGVVVIMLLVLMPRVRLASKAEVSDLSGSEPGVPNR